MTEEDCPPPPDGLQDRGRRFWDAAVMVYDLGLDELELLAEVARELDVAEGLAGVLARDGLMVTGSTGQPRVHPAVSEARASRQAIGRMLAQLSLPTEDDEPAVISPTVARARNAAQARWDLQRAKEGRRRGA